MVMSVMTYAKFNEYRVQSTLQHHFDQYMKYNERLYFNKIAEEKYGNRVVRPKKSTEELSDQEKKEKADKEKNALKAEEKKAKRSLSKMSIGILLERPQQIAEQQKYDAMRSVFKALIINTYGKYSFFAEALKERPDLVDEIIGRLPEAVENLPNKQKITKPKDLANLDLGDQKLNDTFYTLLKGWKIQYESKGTLVEEGYPPLTDFIATGKGAKILVYLATKNVLGALFDPNAIDEIIRTRDFFYNELRRDPTQAKSASERFEKMFEGSVNSAATREFLDFTVSGTNPKK